MNDDYLWDRTGDPDPEIQQLEEVLSTLRYQPEPLVIPAQLQLGQRRRHSSYLAIAAALTVIILGAGWWMLLTTRRATESASVRPTPLETATPQASASPVNPVKRSEQPVKSKDDDKSGQLPRHQIRQPIFARNASRSRTQIIKPSEAIARERSEAEAAKQQLFLALRVASEKLSLAQKRTQGTYPANMIRNQHKVG